MDEGQNHTVFLYQYRDASNYKASGMLLLHGKDEGTEEKVIRENCDGQVHFVAEQVGIPALCGELYAFSDGPTGDDHAFHEFEGIRAASATEADLLPLWGSLKDLTDRFSQIEGHWDCSLSSNYDQWI